MKTPSGSRLVLPLLVGLDSLFAPSLSFFASEKRSFGRRAVTGTLTSLTFIQSSLFTYEQEEFGEDSERRRLLPSEDFHSSSVPFPRPPAVDSSITRSTGVGFSRNHVDIDKVWESLSPVVIQGGSLRTWSFTAPSGVERVQVLMKTKGRPLNANIELWHGPDNTPQKVAIYLEDGGLRSFSAIIETPMDHNALAIYNTGQMEFPLSACVDVELAEGRGDTRSLGAARKEISENARPKTIQGGAIHTIPFGPSVESVALLLETEGRPLNARVELLQGPDNNKQVMEIYTEDGLERPFYAVIETPGVGNVVRIVNIGSIEFPLTASIGPHLITPGVRNYVSEYDRDWDETSNSFLFLN